MLLVALQIGCDTFRYAPFFARARSDKRKMEKLLPYLAYYGAVLTPHQCDRTRLQNFMGDEFLFNLQPFSINETLLDSRYNLSFYPVTNHPHLPRITIVTIN